MRDMATSGGPREPNETSASEVRRASEVRSDARWADWWRVGCGVESVHAVLSQWAGVDVTLEQVLREALALDGYDDELGWRHRALVEVAGHHGVVGAIRGGLTIDNVVAAGPQAAWLVSVHAPEQFASTHLVAVWPVEGGLHLTWPQGQLERGRCFVVEPSWLAPRMTGRGMSYTRTLRAE